MNRRSTCALLALSLAVIGGAIAWLARSGGEAAAVAPESVATESSASEPAPELASGDRAALTVPADIPLAVDDPTAAPEPPSGSPRPFELSGSVTVLDADGIEIPDADGALVLIVWRPWAGGGELAIAAHGVEESVAFAGGTWTKEIADPDTVTGLSVASVLCNGRSGAVESPRENVPLPADRRLDVRARLARTAILRVRDAASGAELAGLALARPEGFVPWAAARREPSFETWLLARGLSSPIDLDRLRASLGPQRQVDVLVGAEGYAWTPAGIDLERGGERLVVLERGAELELTVVGAKEEGVVLRTWATGSVEPLFEMRRWAPGTYELDGLPPGRLDVHAELGEWYDETVLARTSVELAPGTRARAELTVPPRPRVDKAAISGVVHVPIEWKAERIGLRFESLEPDSTGSDEFTVRAVRADASPSGFDAFSWDADSARVGRWLVEIEDPRHREEIELRRGGSAGLVLVVPPPVELALLVRDAESGEPLADANVSWLPLPLASGGFHVGSERGAEPGAYRIRAPLGPIRLSVSAAGRRDLTEKLDLRTCGTERTVRLERACGIQVELHDGDVRVAFPDDWNSWEGLTGPGELVSTSFPPYGLRWTLSAPGTYLLDPPKLPGFLQPPLQVIEVAPGAYTHHVVPLEREHP